MGLPWWLSGKGSTCQHGRHGLDPQSGKIRGAAKPGTTTTEVVLESPVATTAAAPDPLLHNKSSNEKPSQGNYRKTCAATKTQ